MSKKITNIKHKETLIEQINTFNEACEDFKSAVKEEIKYGIKKLIFKKK